MTDILRPAPGRLSIRFIVQSMKNKRRFTTEEIGQNSTMNMSANYKDIVENARLNAIYKHMHKGGASNAITTMVDFDILYFENIVAFRRVMYNGKYYTRVRDRKTGRFIGTSEWKKINKEDLEK